MAIEVSLQAAGTKSGDGTITPSANGTVTITPRAGTKMDLSVDYSAPDAVVVSVDGSFTVLHDRLTLQGGISANVFDGATNGYLMVEGENIKGHAQMFRAGLPRGGLGTGH